MANIVSSGERFGTLYVGPSIVEAMVFMATKKGERSHGTIRVNGSDRERPWRSTLAIGETEKILRLAARSEGRRVTLFISQAVDA